MTNGPVTAALYQHLFGTGISTHRKPKRPGHTGDDAFDALLAVCEASGLTIEEVWHIEQYPEHAERFGIVWT